MSFAYSDMDQLILQRWPDVIGLIEAHRAVQDRIEEMVDIVGERVARWARPQGYDVETHARNSEFQAWRTGWADRRKGAKVQLAVGGFCPAGYKKMDARHPYLFVYIEDLSNFKVKDAERATFSHALRAALGERSKSWDADDVDDTSQPLGRYLTTVSDADRAQIVSSPDALFEFVTAQFPVLFELGDVIDAELVKLGR